LLVLKLLTYMGMARCQHQLEKALIQAIQAGTSIVKLQPLFRPHLDALDASLVDLIRQTQIWQSPVPEDVRFLAGLSHYAGSNNWVVAGQRSVSGFPLECHDPHVESHHLPPLWYEVVLYTPSDFQIGASVPGLAGIVMGRNSQVSRSFTYGFLDTVDFFLEDCRQTHYRRGDRWSDIETRQETIHRKGDSPLQIFVHETDCGVLECDPSRQAFDAGYYLTRACT